MASDLEKQLNREIWDKKSSFFIPANIQLATKNVLFEMFKIDCDCEGISPLLSLAKFRKALQEMGLRKDDPRLKELKNNLELVDTDVVDKETFLRIIEPNFVIISRVVRQNFIIPEWTKFCKTLEDIFHKCKDITDGEVPDYIPELRKMSPEFWGYSVCSVDGQRESLGDCTVPFTLQSCSKPLTYGLALEKLGADVVHQYVGQEPSGRCFNAIKLNKQSKPFNPMVNSGAIVIGSLLDRLIHPEMPPMGKVAYLKKYIERMAGGEPITYNNSVYLSEKAVGYRNYALAFLMKEQSCYPPGTSVEQCLSLYFRTCCIEATCESLSVIAATLANGGICPLTDDKVFGSTAVRDMLSLMHSCGMYDYSGQFAFKVGLPSKSAVSGCLMLVIPNVLGLAVWSPRLDHLGNSCRGTQFCEKLMEKFHFHPYENLGRAALKKGDPRKFMQHQKELSILGMLFYTASGDISILRRHFLSGFDVSLQDFDGRSALHVAAAEGHLHCVKFLLEQCNVPDRPIDRWGRTPYDDAKKFGNTEVVKYLEKRWNTT